MLVHQARIERREALIVRKRHLVLKREAVERIANVVMQNVVALRRPSDRLDAGHLAEVPRLLEGERCKRREKIGPRSQIGETFERLARNRAPTQRTGRSRRGLCRFGGIRLS